MGSSRIGVSLLSLLMLLPLSGCMVCQYAKRTVLDEPSAYSWRGDRKRSVEVYRSWAEEAWSEHGGSACGAGVSSAYETGFKDGFVDYVYAGGSGEPPAIPPRKYWNVGERIANGNVEARDWFAGFRNGAQVAHNEGYREQTLVPASVFFGPEAHCWDGPPGSIDSFAPPIPEAQNPEFLLPGQLESNEREKTPRLPSTESSSGEEMPLPGGAEKESEAPSLREPSVPRRIPGLEPPASPESDSGLDKLFDTSAGDVNRLSTNRILRANHTETGRDASTVDQGEKKQQGVAAFSAAMQSAAMRAASQAKSEPTN